MTPNLTQQKIYRAAIAVAARDGLLAMTLDNVARQAGISKGGLIHHFPTKDDLIAGVLGYFGQQVEEMLLRKVAEDPGPHLRWARGMLACTFPELARPAAPHSETAPDHSTTPTAAEPQPIPADDSTLANPPEDLSPDLIDRFLVAAIAASIQNASLFAPLREIGMRLQRRLLNDERGMEQLLIWLAFDGLMLWQFLGMIRKDDPLYGQIGAALWQRVNEPTAAGGNNPSSIGPTLSAEAR